MIIENINTNLKNVVIVAGGENTRFKEMSIFPKVLLPTLEYPSILAYDCELFKDYNIYLVINNRYANMVREYVNKTKLNINIIVSNNHNGSANTIKELMEDLPQEDILFVWSDLILDKNGVDSIVNSINDLNEYNKSNIFCPNIIFTYNGKYRFKVENNKINTTTQGGNVPGIYYCNSIKGVVGNSNITFPDNFDYIEIFQDYLFNDFRSYEYKGNILEFRDLETYIEYYKNDNNLKTKTRFFNTMVVNDGKLTKTCINSDFYKLIDREICWYNKCKENDYKNIPNIYYADIDKHEICMEYLSGYQNVYEFIKNANYGEFVEFMGLYIDAIYNLHKLNSEDIDKTFAEDDYRMEFYTKVITRCNSIKSILYNYNEDELKNLLEKTYNRIIELSGDITKYCFIHGDLNGSNAMYNKETKDLKFIDPRGYFGKTQLLGPSSYDYAKVMYCLSGYDNFNNGRYKFTSDWYDEPQVLRTYDFGPNQELYSLIVGIIWIALAEYISQDVFKANIAYRHGIKLLSQYIK